MNIYEKLTAARLYFMNAGAKKSGRNEFAKYDYFELADILPIVNRAAKEIGFCCVVSFGAEEATLEFIDSEKPQDRIVFRSPMSTADLKNNHAVQNLGAVETYIRRYLYLAAFEIVESDAVDAAQCKPSPAGKTAESAQAAAQGKDAARLAPLEQKDSDALLEELKAILTETGPCGALLFSEEEKRGWWRRFKKNPKSTVSLLEMEAETRRKGGRA